MTPPMTPEEMMTAKQESMRELSGRLAASGMHAGQFYETAVIEDNAARAAGRPPTLDEYQRTYLERIVGPNPRTPADREQSRIAEEDRQLARDAAARRWKAFIAEPANVDRLIALAGQAPEPTPVVAPWLRKP